MDGGGGGAVAAATREAGSCDTISVMVGCRCPDDDDATEAS